MWRGGYWDDKYVIICGCWSNKCVFMLDVGMKNVFVMDVGMGCVYS